MGRPTKRGLKFFSFDTDFFENDKIQLIEAEFGNNGSHILIRLLAKIYKEGYFYQWGRDQCLLLDRATGREYGTELINKIVDACVQRNFFDKSLYDKYSILTSPEVQYRYSIGVAKRTDIVIIEEYWLIDDEPNCEFEWIKLVANSDGIVIPIFNESEPILSEIDEQTIQEANNDNEPQINYRKKLTSSELLPEETPYIRLDKIIESTTTTTTQNLKNFDHTLFLNNHIIKNHSRLYLEFSDLLNNEWHERLMTKYEKDDLIEALSQMNNKMQSGKYFCLGTTIETWTNTIVRRKQKDKFKGNPNEQNNAKSGSSSTRRSNSRNDGQASTVKYPSCSDGRHPGDLPLEEYARAKAAAKAKRDRETA